MLKFTCKEYLSTNPHAIQLKLLLFIKERDGDMKLICKQENLTKALNIVSKAITNRSTLPILKGILISCESGKDNIIISASDLEISIDTKVEAIVEESGSIVLSSKLFSDIVRKMPSEDLVISSGEGDLTEIKGSSDEFTLQGLPSDEFPRINLEEKGSSFIVKKDILKNLIRKTSFAASNDETRGIITGELIEIKKESITFAALDGFRMAIVKDEISNIREKSIIIASRIIQEIGKVLSETDEDSDIRIVADEKKATFIFENSRIVTRLMEGEFIKYRDILPKENRINIKINRMRLMESVERASIIVREGKNTFIKFAMEDDILTVSSRAVEGTSKGVIPIEKEGENIEIGFNARYILDALKAIDDEEIIMEFNTGISPCIIKPVEGDSFDYLILPVRLSTTPL